MAVDPVCNMFVDERSPAATAVVAGRTYYFCALGCKEAFLELGLGGEFEDEPIQLVDRQGKPLSSQPIPTGVVAILFTDVQGSTRLLEELGEEAGQEKVRAGLERQQQVVQRHGGHAVKLLGDGLMAAFNAPKSALACAVDIQSDEREDHRLPVRIGLHAGEVTADGGDYYGKTVIMAARLTSRARGGEILVSEAFRSLFEPPVGWRFGPTRRVRLKGFPGWYRITLLERTHEVSRQDGR